MTHARVAGAGFWIVIMSAAAAGQQAPAAEQATQPPTSRVSEGTYSSVPHTPWRRVETRSGSNVREVVTQTDHAPGIDGGWQPIQEIETETVRSGAGAAQVRHDVYGFTTQAERRLIETTTSDRETTASGTVRSVRQTSAPDLNGRLTMRSRQVEETRSIGDTRRSETSRFVPGVNDTLEESERMAVTERQVSPTTVRHDSSQEVRDLNGRWQSTETRSREVRGVGSAEQSSEEIVQRPDASGRLAASERIVMRRSERNGREDVATEIYAQNADGYIRSDAQLALSQRVRRSTTINPDGGRSIVEELEARNPVAPNDAMRVVRRTLVTERPSGADRWTAERRIFELNLEGRLIQVSMETEEIRK
jgi:hypothetical protein